MTAMARSNDGIRPDATELRLRFACGAVLGALAGIVTAWQLGFDSMHAAIITAAVASVIAGLLARHFGDSFWASVRWWLWPP